MRRSASARTSSSRSTAGRTRRSLPWPKSRRARLPPDRTRHRPVDCRSDEERALELAYRYIGRRERTTAEVRERLARAELEPAAIEAALRELTGFGYVDDARYAHVFAEDKRALEGWGRGRIERALSERGIDRDLIAAALDGGGDAQREQERAVDLLRRRFPAPSTEPRERERALGVLVRKGYDSEVAYDAVRRWAAAAD